MGRIIQYIIIWKITNDPNHQPTVNYVTLPTISDTPCLALGKPPGIKLCFGETILWMLATHPPVFLSLSTLSSHRLQHFLLSFYIISVNHGNKNQVIFFGPSFISFRAGCPYRSYRWDLLVAHPPPAPLAALLPALLPALRGRWRRWAPRCAPRAPGKSICKVVN